MPIVFLSKQHDALLGKDTELRSYTGIEFTHTYVEAITALGNAKGRTWNVLIISDRNPEKRLITQELTAPMMAFFARALFSTPNLNPKSCIVIAIGDGNKNNDAIDGRLRIDLENSAENLRRLLTFHYDGHDSFDAIKEALPFVRWYPRRNI